MMVAAVCLMLWSGPVCATASAMHFATDSMPSFIWVCLGGSAVEFPAGSSRCCGPSAYVGSGFPDAGVVARPWFGKYFGVVGLQVKQPHPLRPYAPWCLLLVWCCGQGPCVAAAPALDYVAELAGFFLGAPGRFDILLAERVFVEKIYFLYLVGLWTWPPVARHKLCSFFSWTGLFSMVPSSLPLDACFVAGASWALFLETVPVSTPQAFFVCLLGCASKPDQTPGRMTHVMEPSVASPWRRLVTGVFGCAPHLFSPRPRCYDALAPCGQGRWLGGGAFRDYWPLSIRNLLQHLWPDLSRRSQ